MRPCSLSWKKMNNDSSEPGPELPGSFGLRIWDTDAGLCF